MHPGLGTGHELWTAAMPRLLLASYATAVIATILIRIVFRPRRSHLSYRLPAAARHVLSRRK